MNTKRPAVSDTFSDMDILLKEWVKQNWNDRLMYKLAEWVYCVNLEGNILKANTAFRKTWESIHDEWQPNIYSNRMIPEDKLAAELCQETMQDGSLGGCSLRRYCDENDVCRYFNINESPIRSGNRLWGIIGIVRERQSEKNAELAPFYYDSKDREHLEHALRSALGLIRGYAYALDRYPNLDRDKQKRFIGYIREEADRLSRWLDNALEPTYIDQELMATLEGGSLVKVLRSTAHDIGEYASRRGITVEQNIPNTLPEVCASKEAVCRIMGNLLDNAVSISPPEGKIIIAANDVKEGVAVAVTDAGAHYDQQKIVDDFNQSCEPQPISTKHNYSLGLTVAKRLMESIGGKIGVTSGPGECTTFTATFPKPVQKSVSEATSQNYVT